MADVVTMQRKAREIADRAMAQTRSDEATSLSLSEALAALHAHAEEAQRTHNGRELTVFEKHPDRIGRLVDALTAGNYRDTAATLSGIAARSVRGWMEAAERGDSRYEAVAQVIRIAEALAEAASVRNVRAAGKDPRFWAADMTYLERRYPDRWARRVEEARGGVTVIIGARADQVQIGVHGVQVEAGDADAPLNPAGGETDE